MGAPKEREPGLGAGLVERPPVPFQTSVSAGGQRTWPRI